MTTTAATSAGAAPAHASPASAPATAPATAPASASASASAGISAGSAGASPTRAAAARGRALRVGFARRAKDRVMAGLVVGAFILALLPLASLVYTVVSRGIARLDPAFLTESMRNIVGAGGGALHAIVGTLEITALAGLISVPVGILVAIFLVEYAGGLLRASVAFFIDVMTGIPSIVAGLFAFALFAAVTGDAGIRSGFAGAVALSVLMIPVVVRSSEEMLRLVPGELREASLALGVPKWLTIVKVVLPTSAGGLATGVTLAIARVVGETAPLLIVAGFTASMNYNPFAGRMMTLPVFVYDQYATQGPDATAFLDRAWSGALLLVVLVMALNLAARLVARRFTARTGGPGRSHRNRRATRPGRKKA